MAAAALIQSLCVHYNYTAAMCTRLGILSYSVCRDLLYIWIGWNSTCDIYYVVSSADDGSARLAIVINSCKRGSTR